MNSEFHIASADDIRSGETSDIYYLRTKQILDAKKIGKRVVAEVTSGKLPDEWKWGVLCGLDEVIALYKGVPVDVYSVPEGTIFPYRDAHGYRMPLMAVVGRYNDFVSIETATVGLLCQASGIATAAARVKKAAGGKTVFAFGIRRMHPALAPMLDRSAYVGGFDGVSGVAGAKILGIEAAGTMPHPLILIMGDQKVAWKAFDEVVPEGVQRIALVDTMCDEKFESIMAAETLGKRLHGVRLDTPSSRRGDFLEIIREVRWELDLRGYNDIKIYLSGGLDESSVEKLSEGPVAGFGVGTSVANAPTIDFSMDIAEVEGKPVSKRGKYGGRKQVFRCEECMRWVARPWSEQGSKGATYKCEICGKPMRPMLQKIIEKGRVIAEGRSAGAIRDYALSQLERYSLE